MLLHHGLRGGAVEPAPAVRVVKPRNEVQQRPEDGREVVQPDTGVRQRVRALDRRVLFNQLEEGKEEIKLTANCEIGTL